MNLPQVKLRAWTPDAKTIKVPAVFCNAINPNRENKDEPLDLSIPRIKKMYLTEESEMDIFGDISPYGKSMLAPLPWGNEQYFEKKLAIIDEDQVIIYNNKMEAMYKNSPDLIPKKQIVAGVVEVFRAGYNVSLENVKQ